MIDYLEYYKKVSLFEIATIKKIKPSRKKNGDFIVGVKLGDAYKDALESKFKFIDVKWDQEPFSNFSILKDAPPKKLKEIGDQIEFEKTSSLKVDDWGGFLISFHQVRHNLIHGAKLMMGLNLDERDGMLISACLSFIEFMQHEKFIEEIY